MLTLGQQLLNKPVLSLRTGTPIGEVIEPIFNPNNLKIEGWFAIANDKKERFILLSQDIREIIPQGFVVNDHEALTPQAELVRLKPVIQLKFELLGKQIVSADKHNLGKVNDYAFETVGFFIQKLYASQPLIRSFSGGGAIVDRTQIIEITDKKIIVADATVPEKVVQTAASPVAPQEA